jgi:hypothetical protein
LLIVKKTELDLESMTSRGILKDIGTQEEAVMMAPLVIYITKAQPA